MLNMELLKCFSLVFFLTLFFSGSKIKLAQTEGIHENIPVATRWLLDAAGETGRTAIKSVYMIICPQQKGTGFLLKDGPIITAEHVIKGCQPSDILAISSLGEKIFFNNIVSDAKKDLAILIPKNKLDGGLLLGSDENLQFGTSVLTWGFPLGYNGPAPLLSVGFLSGYMAYLKDERNQSFVKHLVVNGAFNPGNSGGPLFMADDNKVIGVVISKHFPMTRFQKSALDALANNESGMLYTATDENGKEIQFFESQLVAELLNLFRNLTQVMIGEAVSVSELRAFLTEQGIEEPTHK